MFNVDKQLNYGRAVVDQFVQTVPSAAKILDVGAGPGHDLAICRRHFPQAQLYALENYAPNVEVLRSQGIEVYPINFEHQAIPLGTESLDLVVSNQVFEHVKEVFWISHEVTRVLKVGGHLLLGVPNLASLHNRLLLAAGMQPTCIQTASAHVRGYTKHDLLRFLNLNFPQGFELANFGGSNFYPFSPPIARPLAKLFPNMAWSIFLLLKKVRPYDKGFLEYPVKERLETPYFLGGN
jgi:SAM-dependent methyltransferase